MAYLERIDHDALWKLCHIIYFSKTYYMVIWTNLQLYLHTKTTFSMTLYWSFSVTVYLSFQYDTVLALSVCHCTGPFRVTLYWSIQCDTVLALSV